MCSGNRAYSTNFRLHMYTDTHRDTHTYNRAYSTNLRLHIYTDTDKQIHAQIHTHTHTHTHTQMHAYIRMCTHTRTHNIQFHNASSWVFTVDNAFFSAGLLLLTVPVDTIFCNLLWTMPSPSASSATASSVI